MFGFLIGTACLLGLISVVRRGRYGRHCGHGGHWDEGGYRGYGGRWGRRGGFGPRVFLRRAFERLDTTPGQEKVVMEAFEQLREALGKARGDVKATRSDFANVVRGPMLDESTMTDIFTKHDATLSEARRAVVEALGKVHEALNEKQRAQLADFLEKGPGSFRGHHDDRWGGPYRSQWA